MVSPAHEDGRSPANFFSANHHLRSGNQRNFHGVFVGLQNSVSTYLCRTSWFPHMNFSNFERHFSSFFGGGVGEENLLSVSSLLLFSLCED